MAQLIRYGSTNPVYFKATLSGDGVTGLTFATDDVQLSKDGAAFADISSAITEVGLGWYKWTPAAAANTQCKTGIINIKDQSATAVFDENGVVFVTGGDASAFYDGT